MRRTASIALVLACAALAVLPGCSRYAGFTHIDPIPGRSLTRASYDAADMLAGQALNIINRDTPLAVGTLSNIDRMENSSALGRMIAEQVGARFVQLGYNVTEIKLRQNINVQQEPGLSGPSGEYMLSRNVTELAASGVANAVISGTYAVAGDSVLVNLRLVDVGSGRILAAHDYGLPMSHDVRKLLEPTDDTAGIFSSGWAQ